MAARLALAKVLKRKKLSKRKFAKRIGVEYQHVFRFFKSSYNPTLKSLNRFAKALACKVRDLLDES